jgi:lipid II:glycine glycyltransferase (peptidoglycan interpeptide bridge formation enzyme)
VILLSRLGNELLAGHVVLRHGSRAVYTFGASSPGRSRGVPKSQLGLWRAIQWAKAAGCSIFDLGGIDPAAGVGTPRSSINQFKRGFSTHQIELLLSYEKVLRPVRHAVVETAQKTAARFT